MDYKAILFDLDGTLSPTDQPELYPDALAWLNNNYDGSDQMPIAIVTNQGGVGLRIWMEKDGFGEPDKWPTADMFELRLERLFPYASRKPPVYRCYRYQSKASGKWSPVPEGCEDFPYWRQDWRKPAPGMLLQAMEHRKVAPADTLMVGDRDEDQKAAKAAGCHFMWAWQFFCRAQ